MLSEITRPTKTILYVFSYLWKLEENKTKNQGHENKKDLVGKCKVGEKGEWEGRQERVTEGGARQSTFYVCMEMPM
jgi:hypothetical protein